MSMNARAFGECQKVILTTAGTIDLSVDPPTGTYSLPIKYKFMHIISVGAANVTVSLRNDINSGGSYTFDLTTQLAGVSKILVNSGFVEVLLFV